MNHHQTSPCEKYALISYSTWNIGDDIQSLAARRFVPRVDYYVDRDRPHLARDLSPACLIANGWYAKWWRAQPFPEQISPVMVALHLINAKNLQGPIYEYYKKHEPIGCRDKATCRIFESVDIKAFFTGCLTLTLPPYEGERSGEIIVTDPEPWLEKKIPAEIANRCVQTTHKTSIGTPRPFLGRRYFDGQFLRTLDEYRGPFRESARALAHSLFRRNDRMLDPNNGGRAFVEKRFEHASSLLERYKKAALIITSRIHVALPARAFGTPVIYGTSKADDPRLDGLKDVLRPVGPSDRIDWEGSVTDVDPIRNPLSSLVQRSLLGER